VITLTSHESEDTAPSKWRSDLWERDNLPSAKKTAMTMYHHEKAHRISFHEPRNSICNWPMKRFHQTVLSPRPQVT